MGRGLIKITAIFIVTILIIFVCSHFIDEGSLEFLKHNLSLWTIIALVVIINLVSFLCFVAMYFTYRWIKKDFSNKDDDKDEL